MTLSTDRLTVAEVAKTMKTTEINVMMHIKKQLISAEEIDGTWFVAKGSLMSYLDKTDRPQPNNLCKSSCKRGCSGCG